jgi:hypothetical protein
MPTKILYFKWVNLNNPPQNQERVSHLKYFSNKRSVCYLYNGKTEESRISIDFLRDKTALINYFNGYWEEVEEAEFALL